MNRSTLHAGLRIAAEHPSLILWYLENRLRTGLLPLERALGDGRGLPPRFVTLKPTLRCNLRCEFCRFVANGDVFGKRDWMDLSDWRRVVDEIAPFRPYVCITGGEPTLVPYLPDLIAHIKSRGLRCVLTTNGTMLAQRAEALMQAPPDAIVLSLDGPRAVHDAVRGRDGAFDQALRGVRQLQGSGFRVQGSGVASRQLSAVSSQPARAPGAESPQHPTPTHPHTHTPTHPYLVLNAAITGHTYESALEMVEVAREFGAFALNFQHFWFLTRPMVDRHNARWGDCFPLDFDHVGGTATEGVDTDRLWETIQRLKGSDFGFPITFFPELDREAMRTYYAEPERFTHRFTPSCAWISTDILPNGDVSPCFDLVCGNVLRQPFREIWNAASFREHRQRLGGGPYSICARCCAYFRHD